MMSGPIRKVPFTVIAIFTAGAVMAQELTDDRIMANTDWSAFKTSDPVECFAVTKPKEQINTRDGQPVEVQRGETLLFVFYRPAEGVDGQIAFTGGYPFADCSSPTLTIEGAEFQLQSCPGELDKSGEWAWAADTDADAAIIDAMRRGSEAIITGVSGRGTQTEDRFSLLGFSSMLETASQQCAS